MKIQRIFDDIVYSQSRQVHRFIGESYSSAGTCGWRLRFRPSWNGNSGVVEVMSVAMRVPEKAWDRCAMLTIRGDCPFRPHFMSAILRLTEEALGSIRAAGFACSNSEAVDYFLSQKYTGSGDALDCEDNSGKAAPFKPVALRSQSAGAGGGYDSLGGRESD